MSRKVRDANLETRTARGKLASQGKPYYRSLGPGLHVGYRKGNTGGRWVVRWYAGDGSYVLRTLDGIADDHQSPDGVAVLNFGQAQEAARRLWRAETAPAPVAGPLTVRAAVADYIAFLTAERRTGADAKSRLGKHVVPAIGDRLVAELTKAEIEAVKRAMIRSDPADPEIERRSKDTANRVLASLKAALNRAFRDPANGIPSDHAWRTVGPFRDVARARQVHLDAVQSRRLVNTARGRFRDLVTAGLVTGARPGELPGMLVQDFHAGLRTLAVRDGKTGPREIVLTPEGVRFFVTIAAGREPDALLLPRDDGARWQKQHVIRAMRVVVKAAKLPKGTVFYSLRHTYASQSLLGGINMQLLAENMGTSIRMLEQNYGKFLASNRRKLIEESGFTVGLRLKSTVTPMRPKRRPAA